MLMYPDQDAEKCLIKEKTRTFMEKQTTAEEFIRTNSQMYANVGYNQGSNDLNVKWIFF